MDGKVDNTDIGGNDSRDSARNKLEVSSTLVLAIATLAIAWCSYQTVLWSGIQTFKLAGSNKFNRLAQQKMIVAGQNKAMDESLLIAFVTAAIENKQHTVDYSLRGVRPELSTIMRKWLSLKPFENKSAYPHPMAMPEYLQLVERDMAESDKLRKQAEEYQDAAQKANENSDNYSLLTVVFSMAMFLGAITTKINRLKLGFTIVFIAGLICISVLILLFLFMPLAHR